MAFPKTIDAGTIPYNHAVMYGVKKLNKATSSCSCVLYVEKVAGIDLPQIGYARNLKTNSKWPQIGSIVKTNEGWAGHLAVVSKIEGNTITIEESNYVPCQKGTRQLKLDDERILGYYELL